MIEQISIQRTCGVSSLPQVHALRYEVLRKPHSLPFESTAFPGDNLDSTLHLLASWNERAIGCVSLMFQDNSDQIQLRGMAVDQEFQGQGVGNRLLLAAHSIAQVENRSLWCNARLSAIGFYRRHGWECEGQMFEIPVIGLHSVMKWQQMPVGNVNAS